MAEPSRYIGQCNIQTDIKESVFLGADDNLVACGSDDGRIYIYHTVRSSPPSTPHLASPNSLVGLLVVSSLGRGFHVCQN